MPFTHHTKPRFARDAAASFEALVETALAFSVAADGTVVWASESWLAALGIEESDRAEGVRIDALLPPEGEPLWTRACAVVGDVPTPVELVLRRRDGRRVHLAGRAERPSGSGLAMRCMVHDVTALIEERDRSTAMLGALTEGVALIGADGVILRCNESGARILGAPSSYLVGKRLVDLPWSIKAANGTPLGRDDLPALVTLRSGEPTTDVLLEVSLPKQERTCWVQTSARAMRRSADEPVYAVVTSFVDVTERVQLDTERQALSEETLAQAETLEEQNIELQHQAEELMAQTEELQRRAFEIEETREFLDALIASSRDAIVTFDHGLRFRIWNPAMERMSGVPAARAIGRTAAEVFPHLEQNGRIAHYEMAVRGEATSLTDVSYAHDGVTTWYDIAYSPIRDHVGAIIGGMLTARDVTERVHTNDALRAAMREAEQANQAKSAFLARMSHELRTPLNSIIGFSKVLLRDAAEGTPREYLGRVNRAGMQLLHLINDILDLSKVEAGKIAMATERVDVVELARDCVSQLEGQARVGVLLGVDAPSDPIAAVADAARLRQVVMNLIGNALKFTERGNVTVSVRPGDAGVVIEVRDTGIGIAADRQAAVFEPFEQAASDTAHRFGGTGLGLTISRSLCARMGGELTLESAPGVGSTFRVVLPAAA